MAMVKQYDLLGKGFFPETLPPCFVSLDIKRAMRGITTDLNSRKFHAKRSTNYSRLSGTKHDGNRRSYSTPNPISYFYVCNFIERYWITFQNRFSTSPFSVSAPRIGSAKDDRAIIVPSLSELSGKVDDNIKYSPFILKTDISQFFHSIYTHSIPWSAHGIEKAKADQNKKSKKIKFNELDYYVQNTQRAQTRGVLIGPDAFRLIAEFISCDIDIKLRDRADGLIVGAVRHVDDFYIGVRSEIDALSVLSHLRDVLQSYELQINDSKTRVLNGLEPVDDVWAQHLRSISIKGLFAASNNDVFYMIDKAYELAKSLKTESPIKIAIRRIDKEGFYKSANWAGIEKRLQRIIYHFPHAIDYVCLVVAKRFAIGEEIDRVGWKEAIYNVLGRAVSLNHHHEVLWLLWLLITCSIDIEKDVVERCSKMDNSHVRAILVEAFVVGKISIRPPISMSRLETSDEFWLHNLVARANGFTKSPFHGVLKEEFEHLASRNVKLIDFESHLEEIKKEKVRAISSSRYGYDSDDEDEDDDEDYDPAGFGPIDI
ncbi:RNA-directed DNA polymerase [Azospirillum sp. YIM DDC1]|uniref:RNA-directed DNA polymerase n=1 Tax=Azospirillum aestuarii TaxID=2802052 RepID=A0ABS1HS22_9PROT|nr:RNA-directed DNA polymerase [Azospirillum aestuarii]MBK4717612.1 RNA-directed DNA polymerase [Azospirillum aestuarii]